MKEESNDLRVYTTQEVADILRVCEMTVRRYIKLGKIKALDTKVNIGYKSNGALRISHREISRFVNGGEQ